MTKEVILEKMAELTKNEKFKSALEQADTHEDMLKAFADFGLSITEAEMDDVMEYVASNSPEKLDEAELDETALEDVAGGVGALGWAIIIVSIAIYAKWVTRKK